MIIYINENKLNKQACSALLTHHSYSYTKDDYRLPSEQKLILIDLDTETDFPQYYNPGAFAERLIAKGLTVATKDILFLVPEMKKESNLFEFAQGLVNFLCEHFKCNDIKAYVPFDNSDHRYLFFCPPADEKGRWKVYGLIGTVLPSNTEYEKLLSLTNKKGIELKSSDIERWLMSPQQTITYSNFANQHHIFN